MLFVMLVLFIFYMLVFFMLVFFMYFQYTKQRYAGADVSMLKYICGTELQILNNFYLLVNKNSLLCESIAYMCAIKMIL